ncbi:proprotein convertase P-domain-containing protein [Candidatus Woesebacteria bacterium]|nr:proprotein convertase P-domain-containing protein [Candidatus Woesebacteria bacterium]
MKKIILATLALIMVTACTPANSTAPTITPIVISVSTTTSTPTLVPTATATATITPTPEPFVSVIKDNETVTRMITKTSDQKVGSLTLVLNIDHEFVGDLWIELEHDGVKVLVLGKLGCGGSDIRAIFSDLAEVGVRQVCENDVALEGRFTPQESFAVFTGMDFSGEWKLTILDEGDADEGSLNGWDLKNN